MNKMGFGFLRLPRMNPSDEKSIDYVLLNRMVDAFIRAGGDYFDTAYTYLGGESERALRETLVKRYPRGSFRIADKLPGYRVKAPEDCRRYFDEQLERCGVDFFDVYMLHWLNRENYRIACEFDEFGFLSRLKAEGLAKRIGFSYHDTPELLDEILTAHPEVDVVQLQINYLDWESEALQARRCYETAVKYGKPVIVMEPAKGGALTALPEEAGQMLRRAGPDETPAGWAMRFVQGLPQVEICLSGMNTMEQMEENMRDVQPLTEEDCAVLARVCAVIRSATAVPCTGCRYCVEHCPVGIAIPDCFAMLNDYARAPQDDWKMTPAYRQLTSGGAKASACLECRTCEAHCPQHLEISQYMKRVAAAFEG